MTSPFSDRDQRIAFFQQWFSDTIPHSKALGLKIIAVRRGYGSMQLDWREERVSFEVDDIQVFESQVSPNPPLGLVIWIDNQYAAFTPAGKIGFGVLENPEPAWLKIQDIELA